MKINTKIRYGLRTMIELCHSENSHGILQKDIAKNQQLSEKYLDPIISALKTKGLIINVAGKKSGYILNKPKAEITLFDIFNSFENGPEIVPCMNKYNICDRSNNCVAKGCWTELNDIVANYMKNTTLEDLNKKESEYENKIEITEIK